MFVRRRANTCGREEFQGVGACPPNSFRVGDSLLVLDGLYKSFGGVAAVRGVSATLARGEIRGLIGPNGSGKTTLLNLVGGQVRPDAGRISLDGRPITGLAPDRVAARGVARTFQLPRVFWRMTVVENLLVPSCADHRRTPWREAYDDAEALLRLVRLEPMRHVEARMLSGGQAVLLQLARCLAAWPLEVCLLDEPFAGVHPAIKDRMIDAILDINRTRGVAFLVVSHEMTTLRRLAPRVSVMHNGVVIAEGTLDEVAGDPTVIEAYLGRGGSRASAGRSPADPAGHPHPRPGGT